ncbi:MAG TPA: C40 family peptidase, partial [Acidimicrobiales bacterium]|nr:C40 family peptidase [Acidimicrobiales bacterium]
MLRAGAAAAAAVLGLTLCIPFAAAALAAGALDPTGTSSGPPGATSPAGTAAAPSPSDAATEAVAWALARVGTSYRWGGTGAGGFDCSGLVQAAYGAAGVALPRVAQDQFDAGPPAAGPLVPGDLVFFGTGPLGVDHVGIALGDGLMVDAPHTGAVVRVEAIWHDGYVSATRPAP